MMMLKLENHHPSHLGATDLGEAPELIPSAVSLCVELLALESKRVEVL